MSHSAYKKKLRISDDGGLTWHDLPATSPSMEVGGELLDNTNLATNEGYRTRCYGLNEFSVSADSIYCASTTAFRIIKNAWMNQKVVRVAYLPTGQVDGTGLSGDVIVENMGWSGEVASLEQVSISLQGAGGLTKL